MSIRTDMSAIRTKLIEFINSALTDTGETVVIAGQNAPRPDPPFVSLKITAGSQKVGALDEKVYSTARASFVQKAKRRLTVQITAFGSAADNAAPVRALDIIEDIRVHIDNPVGHDILRSAGLSVMGDTNITDLTEALETTWLPKAILDLNMLTTFLVDYDPGSIETVKINEGTFNVPGGGQLTTGQIEINKP